MQTNKQRHKLIKKKQKLQTKIKNILFNLISDNGFLDQCILIILSPFAHHCASNQQQHGHNRGQSDNLRLRRVSTQCRLTHSTIQINRNHLLILHIQWRHRILLILFLFAIISAIIPFITWTIISAVRWRWSLNRLWCLRPRRIRWSRSSDRFSWRRSWSFSWLWSRCSDWSRSLGWTRSLCWSWCFDWSCWFGN